MISETQWGHFVDANDTTWISGFNVTPNNPYKFGWVYTGPSKDFDIAYVVNMVQQGNIPGYTSKACIFVVTAIAPAHPDVSTIPKNGAKCSWVDTGIGEDYYAE